MSKYIDANALIDFFSNIQEELGAERISFKSVNRAIDAMTTIDIVRCKECRKSHIDGKTTHYLWCTEWGRSTDTFGYCERGEESK